MANYKATVSSVDLNATVQKKDGTGSYKAVTLVYTTSAGKEIVKNVAHSFLKTNSALGESLKTLKTGDVVYLEMENFNLQSISKTNPNPTQSYSSGKYSSNTTQGASKAFDTFGAQVGNALNVAATLISTKTTKTTDLKDMAVQVLQIGEELKAMLTSGNITATVTPPAITAPQHEDLNDEVPF